MPVQLTYPGVYVEEIPSGVHTITGVATSITAFVGRALRGPVNEPFTINSFADFQRNFGGLQVGMPMGYAVKDFYQNGGSQAIIVRLFNNSALNTAQTLAGAAQTAAAASGATAQTVQTAVDSAATPLLASGSANSKAAAQKIKTAVDNAASATGATPATVAKAASDAAADPTVVPPTRAQLSLAPSSSTGSALVLEAANEGSWGSILRARATYPDSATAAEVISSQSLGNFGVTESDLFNLAVKETSSGAVETFQNVTVKKNTPRSLDRVLENESSLVGILGSMTSDKPKAHADPGSGVDIWKDNTPATSVGVSGNGQDSDPLQPDDYKGSDGKGIYALQKADLFNLLCIPPDTRGEDTDASVYSAAMIFCAARRAMLIVDPPAKWGADRDNAVQNAIKGINGGGGSPLQLNGTQARNAAVFFPRVLESDPLLKNQIDTFVPCGLVAGAMARTDAQRGVWKAPAGIDVSLNGTLDLQVNLNDDENGQLNPLAVNCLRSFPVFGRIVWGARTMRGADQVGDEYKYIPVRRMALYLEESLYRGLKWAVFEPNGEVLWSQIRLNAGAFMHDLFVKGAFKGTDPSKAYFVKCDAETTTQNDIDHGIVNVVVGFAPLKPAEFVVIQIQQIAGEIQT